MPRTLLTLTLVSLLHVTTGSLHFGLVAYGKFDCRRKIYSFDSLHYCSDWSVHSEEVLNIYIVHVLSAVTGFGIDIIDQD